MISVVIPLYNCRKYIVRAIQSILSQTILPEEIIVVNDGSTDGGNILVEQLSHPLVRLINQGNAGVSAARNKGIAESKQEFIAFLDADDEWLPNHLETLISLTHLYPQCGLFASPYYIKPMDGKAFLPSINNSLLPTKHGIIDNYYKLAAYSGDMPMHINSILVRKEMIQKIGGFPIGIPAGEDIVTIARLYSVCDFAYTKQATIIYYLTPNEGKSHRPVLLKDPIDSIFHSLKHLASHRKNVRLYIASWHRRRMVGAVLAKKYLIAINHWCIAFTMAPFYRKLYSATIVAIYCNLSGKNIYKI